MPKTAKKLVHIPLKPRLSIKIAANCIFGFILFGLFINAVFCFWSRIFINTDDLYKFSIFIGYSIREYIDMRRRKLIFY